MHLVREFTLGVIPLARFLTLDRVGAHVAIYTSRVFTAGAMPARRRACNLFEYFQLGLGRLMMVRMRAAVAKGAVVTNIVNVAHFDFLDAFVVVGIYFQNIVNALALFVARHCGEMVLLQRVG